MKIFTSVLSLLIVLVLVYLMCENSTIYMAYQVPLIKYSNLNTPYLWVVSSMLVAAFFAGATLFFGFYASEKSKNKNYKGELDKSSVSNKEDSDKVKVLENKIATLEKALADATKQ